MPVEPPSLRPILGPPVDWPGTVVAAVRTALAFLPALGNDFVSWDDDRNFLNLNVHFHTLILDESETGGLRFHPASPPGDEEVARLLATIRARVRRLLARRGLEPQDVDLMPPDPLAEESLALAGISSASVQGRVSLGRRAGTRVLRLGRDPDAPCVTSTGPAQAHEDFDLHANLFVPAEDRARLEQLRRYLLRPPVAQDRLRLTGDGRILLELKSAWHDGTGHLLFEPLELLEKLAA